MVPFWLRRRIMPSKEAGLSWAYFSVTVRKVLDGYEEMSILMVSGINILFYKNNWAAGSASLSWAFYICCPPADCCLYYNILLYPTKNSPLPLKLHEAANRGRSEMLCVQENRDNSLSKGHSEAVGYCWNCVTSQHGACAETLQGEGTGPSKTSTSRVWFTKALRSRCSGRGTYI